MDFKPQHETNRILSCINLVPLVCETPVQCIIVISRNLSGSLQLPFHLQLSGFGAFHISIKYLSELFIKRKLRHVINQIAGCILTSVFSSYPYGVALLLIKINRSHSCPTGIIAFCIIKAHWRIYDKSAFLNP